MSIAITITDPANTPRADLALIITLLQRFHDSVGQDSVRTTPLPPPIAQREVLPPAAALDPQDSPDAGLPVITPEAAFASAPPAADLADAVAAFESTLGNVTAPSTTPAGTPPAPPNGAQTAGVPTQANGVDVDKNGLPWDSRIHAGTKGKNADGSWTARRGVDKTTVPAIEAELRAVMAIPSPAAAVTPPQPVVGVPSPSVAAIVTPPPPAAVVTPPPPPAVVTPPPPPAAVPTPGAAISFPDLLQKIARLVEVEKVLTQADIVAALTVIGAPSLPVAAARPDLLTQISDILDATAAQRRAGA
jgi:hypothetical protein